jgi:hypothetical protein
MAALLAQQTETHFECGWWEGHGWESVKVLIHFQASLTINAANSNGQAERGQTECLGRFFLKRVS